MVSRTVLPNPINVVSFPLSKDSGGRFLINQPPTPVVLNGDQVLHTNSTLYARISPQWLSKLRQLWLSIPRQVASQLTSPIGFYIVPGQHSRPTPTLLGQGLMHV